MPTRKTVQIKLMKPGEMLRERLRISLHAQQTMTAEQVHRQIQRNGSVPSRNRFYNGRDTEEHSFHMLNTAP